MKTLRHLMNKVTVDPTRMTSLGIGDGVGDHLQPIIAKSSEPVSELGSGLVSSAHTIMSFFECFFCASLCESVGAGFHHMIGSVMSA